MNIASGMDQSCSIEQENLYKMYQGDYLSNKEIPKSLLPKLNKSMGMLEINGIKVEVQVIT